MPKKKEELRMRPYARLLTMLSEQLIKNEIIALSELIKNAYDAGSKWVEVNFENFGENYEIFGDSQITISDTGCGMNKDIIVNHFMNPATSVKKHLDSNSENRVPQGEKGIGRFSMFKLGNKVNIITKTIDENFGHNLTFDFSDYDNEFLQQNGEEKEIYLDSIYAEYEKIYNVEILKKNKGTIIEITGIKGSWNSKKVREFVDEMVRFIPIKFQDKESNKVKKNTFEIRLLKDGIKLRNFEEAAKEIRNIVEHKAVIKITDGFYDEKKKTVSFNYQKGDSIVRKGFIDLVPKSKDIMSRSQHSFTAKMQGLSLYRGSSVIKEPVSDYFGEGETTSCGSFSFKFYVFDFSGTQLDPYGLNKNEKNRLRNHRVFLYRDGVRVQPYGASDDDWLEMDRRRAATKASEIFSNDQILGEIGIGKFSNPNLIDKTNREGLITDDESFKQMITLIGAFLSTIRVSLYMEYIYSKNKRKEEDKKSKQANYTIDLQYLANTFKSDKQLLKRVKNIEDEFHRQDKQHASRMKIVENLAGIGLSVEMAAHDTNLTISRLVDKIGYLRSELVQAPLTIMNNLHSIQESVISAEEGVALLRDKMKNIDQLFASSSSRPKNVRIEEIIRKVELMYGKKLRDADIVVKYNLIGISPLIVRIVDAFVYQIFINLFDNACYFLDGIEGTKIITITLDSERLKVIFSDNGPGISSLDKPFVFDAFYSTKGEEGKGLGMYIAKRLLERGEFNIYIPRLAEEVIHEGANFVIDFAKNNESDGSY
ncbi:sensor histidine kinase [Mycoplasmatota bacterium]|nr:sensor histidine kinase [Mycoplasmatota bacterium]